MTTKTMMRGTALFALGAIVFATPSYTSARASTAVLSAASSEPADAHILDVQAITEVFADGLKVSAVAVKYDKNISDASLKPSAFEVTTDAPSQTIKTAYTSLDGLKSTKRGQNGPWVILELSTDYVIPVSKPVVRPIATPPPPGGPPRQEPPKQDVVLNSEVVTKVGNVSWEPAAHPATLKSSKHGGNGKSASVKQIGDVKTTDGLTLTAASTAKDNVYVRNLIVDGFMKPDFATGAHGNVKYNIHFPSNYDPNKSYPVVMFLDDADSPTGFTHAEYLIHGQGGVIWASKEDDQKHPAIVLVPALSRSLVNPDGEPATQTRPGGTTSIPYLSILDLVDGLPALVPNIDRSRIYITGQGDGARAALRMMMDRPNTFAAGLLFAPDYDPAKIAPLAKAKLWVVVSEGDTPSYTAMQASIASLKAAGAQVNESQWSGQESEKEFAAAVHSVAAAKKNVDFTVLKKGTTIPAGQPDDALDNHGYTWRVGYAISPLRDWLFTQQNPAPAAK